MVKTIEIAKQGKHKFMTTIYNSLNTLNYIPNGIVLIVSIVFIIIGAKLIISMIKSKANFFKHIIQYLFFGIFLAVGVYVFFTTSENTYYEIRYVVIPYSQGNYEVIEGEVTNYQATGYDREINFEINGENFTVNNYEIGNVGYQGHDINEGDYLKIRYFDYNDNIILRVDKKE